MKSLTDVLKIFIHNCKILIEDNLLLQNTTLLRVAFKSSIVLLVVYVSEPNKGNCITRSQKVTKNLCCVEGKFMAVLYNISLSYTTFQSYIPVKIVFVWGYTSKALSER